MAEANPPLNEKYLERIAALRLIDDEFFSEALDGKIVAVQVLVDTILERTDLKVISAKSQVTYKSAACRFITLTEPSLNLNMRHLRTAPISYT